MIQSIGHRRIVELERDVIAGLGLCSKNDRFSNKTKEQLNQPLAGSENPFEKSSIYNSCAYALRNHSEGVLQRSDRVAVNVSVVRLRATSGRPPVVRILLIIQMADARD